MKIYLAARYQRREELYNYGKILEEKRLDITSRWLSGQHGMLEGLDPESSSLKNATFAKEDLEDIDRADMFLLFTDEPMTVLKKGGMFVELGYALAHRKYIVIVGPRENVFCFLPQITVYKTFNEFLSSLV